MNCDLHPFNCSLAAEQLQPRTWQSLQLVTATLATDQLPKPHNLEVKKTLVKSRRYVNT